MKRILFTVLTLLFLTSHDMFLKMDTYHLDPHSESIIKLYNGTFEKSDNVITRNRMIDVSLYGHGVRTTVDTSQWTEADNITLLHFKSGDPGTWVAGVSTKPNDIELKAEDFNGYLKHDGVMDMLQYRREHSQEDSDAVEKYSKHVKAIFSVGDKYTEDWRFVFGYPVEFVPMSNPYQKRVGDDLAVQLLAKGAPLTNQLVYVGSSAKDHGHDHPHDDGHNHDEEEGHHHDATQLRTDENGVVRLSITEGGQWYLRTIHMVLSDEEEYTHESNWATLTFEIDDLADEGSHTHSHGGGSHTHGPDTHTHSHMPMYLYALGGALLLIGIFLLWRTSRRKE